MIIVLKPNTTEKNITRVENLVKNRGLDTHLVRGTEMTIIGCIGDTTLIDPRLFEVDESVDKVMHVQEPYKLANRAFHPEDSIIDVSGVQSHNGETHDDSSVQERRDRHHEQKKRADLPYAVKRDI